MLFLLLQLWFTDAGDDVLDSRSLSGETIHVIFTANNTRSDLYLDGDLISSDEILTPDYDQNESSYAKIGAG